MTPQFLRSEAARFREMAEAVTDREASRQRLLAMAIDYDARAAAAEEAQPAAPLQARRTDATGARARTGGARDDHQAQAGQETAVAVGRGRCRQRAYPDLPLLRGKGGL